MTKAEARELEYQAIRKYLKMINSPEGGMHEGIAVAVEDELTDRQKEMVHMYYIRQMRMQDIAESLDVNVSTVSRTLERGRVRLRRCLKYGGPGLLEAIDSKI